MPANLKSSTKGREPIVQVNYNSQHASKHAQPRRKRTCGRSCDLSMAVFADLDLRAGSDLKALRGLVENAAHRELPRFGGSWCLPSFVALQTAGLRSGVSRPGRSSFVSLGRPWKLMPTALLLGYRALETQRHWRAVAVSSSFFPAN